MASTCSVTCMEPISAVIPELTRAAIIRLVSTGPSSRTRERETREPT